VEKYNELPIFFCTAHPGWADTPAVRISMPDFYSRFHKEFRTPQQGADTIVWAAVCEKARTEFENGAFLEDRKAVSEHLPMAGTKSTKEERGKFIKNLEKLIK
jgi:dehydrogenase/reductase SDR family member 12